MKSRFSTTLGLIGGTAVGALGLHATETTTRPTQNATTSSTLTPTSPSDCIAGPFQITSFTWFNSSNNLNCPLDPDPEFLCYTGRPVQPPGYGPPDYVSFTVLNVASDRSASCIYQNPGSVPARGEPGRAASAFTKCGTGDQTFLFAFTAGPEENGDDGGGGAAAELSVIDRVSGCEGVNPRGSGNFSLTCTIDPGMNSTCVQTESLVSLPYSGNF